MPLSLGQPAFPMAGDSVAHCVPLSGSEVGSLHSDAVVTEEHKPVLSELQPRARLSPPARGPPATLPDLCHPAEGRDTA